MKYLGIDYGTKRIGLALSDADGRVAFPHSVAPADLTALTAIDRLCKESGVGALVVGESRDLSGKPNPLQEDIDEFARDLGALTGLPVHFEREFFTSALAARHLAPEEKTRKAHPSHEKLDASAAALILQSYLDRQK
jgi:putative Holliday junction resolvase